MEKLDEFVDDSFWHELSVRLAERDLAKEVGEDAFEEMDGEERIQRLGEIEDKYTQEFFEFGIDRVTIDGKKPRP